MTDLLLNIYTAFNGHRRIASGSLQTVALVVKQAIDSGAADPVLIFDDTTGRSIDINTRGSRKAVMARFAQAPTADAGAEAALPERARLSAADSAGTGASSEPRGRGRPKLGVIPREVTLLPRHWEWLATQPGGASVALRKLVEAARRTHAEQDSRRKAQERAYYFMSAIAGDMPRFEEATRALFADDQRRFRKLVARWPDDVRDHAIALAFGDHHGASPRNTLIRSP